MRTLRKNSPGQVKWSGGSTIQALMMTQTKHIGKRAIKSLKYFDEVPLNKIMTTVKV
jgi:hypothetical protein